MRDRPRILIIDDNENNRAITAARLGADALGAVRREPPDLILLDVTMPQIDGLEARRRLKSDGSLGFMPMILVTACSYSQDVVAAWNRERMNI